LATSSFRNCHPSRVGKKSALHYLVVRKPSLYDHSSPLFATPHQSCGSHKERHRLFCGPITGSQKFLIEIEEGDDISGVDSVKRRFGTNNDSRSRSAGIGPPF
jgi:hypothetical protein